MSKSGLAFECNYAEVFEDFRKLTVDEMHKALRKGVSKALNKIKKDAQSNLSANYNGVNTLNPKYNDTLIEGIRVTKIKTDEHGIIEGVVRAHSNGKHGSGSYRLHFLEKGTKDRYVTSMNGKPLRKKAYRGRIVARQFFKPAVDETVAVWADIIDEEVQKAVNKINKKVKQ